MCSGPEHTKEFRNIAETMVRMETKLDNVLTIVGDHEARLRVAEASIIVHNDNKPDYDVMKTDMKNLAKIVEKNESIIAGWSKALWIMGSASLSGLGLGIWGLISRGTGN